MTGDSLRSRTAGGLSHRLKYAKIPMNGIMCKNFRLFFLPRAKYVR